MDNNTFSAFSNGDEIFGHNAFIGQHIDDYEDYLREMDIFANDMVRISTTDEDRYFFYKVTNDDKEDRCIEAYFNPDGIIYDIQIINY